MSVDWNLILNDPAKIQVYIVNAFNKVDKNHDGSLDISELSTLLGAMAE